VSKKKIVAYLDVDKIGDLQDEIMFYKGEHKKDGVTYEDIIVNIYNDGFIEVTHETDIK